ncbi:MAG: hypothetical protein NT155_01855 [Candidatus Staskawiczbacteria bacterium]|nr:hypothetical protein [Candidatus Staskawiczbacteria bacterium]
MSIKKYILAGVISLVIILTSVSVCYALGCPAGPTSFSGNAACAVIGKTCIEIVTTCNGGSIACSANCPCSQLSAACNSAPTTAGVYWTPPRIDFCENTCSGIGRSCTQGYDYSGYPSRTSMGGVALCGNPICGNNIVTAPETCDTGTFPASSTSCTGGRVCLSNCQCGFLPATVTINAATNITSSTATITGNITNIGGDNPTVAVCLGTVSGNPNWCRNVTSPAQPQGVGVFSYNITGLSQGTTYYFAARATNGGGENITAYKSFVAISTLDTITLTPTTVNITNTSPVTLTAVGKDLSGNTMTLPTLNWTSSDNTVASVAGGVITPLKAGTTNITTTGSGITSNTVAVTVTPTLSSITLSPTSVTITNTTPVTVTATGKDQFNNTMTLPTLTWSTPSPNNGVITDTGGTITPLKTGTTSFYTTGGGVQSNTVSVNVTIIVLPSITTSTVSSITTNSAVLNVSVANTGGEDPYVAFYWGTSDQGQTANWDHYYLYPSPQGTGNFSYNITGLNSATKYYFSASATNHAGITWSSTPPSPSFTTAFVDTTPPQVIAGGNKIELDQFHQDAAVSDPAPSSGIASYNWTTVSCSSFPSGSSCNKNTVVFTSPATEDTFISANAPGIYRIRLTATDNAGNSNSSDFYLTWDNSTGGTSHNVYGWAWSENIGWISLNRYGTTDWQGNNIPGGTANNYDYGVNIESKGYLPGSVWSDNIGYLSGYGWSDNIGWVRFSPDPDFTKYPTCGYPEAPCYSSCVDLPGAGQACDGAGNFGVTGWIRACSVFNNPNACSGPLSPSRGNWGGWIKLHNVSIDIDPNHSPAEFHNWMWGSDDDSSVANAYNEAITGWTTFNCAEGNASGTSICGTGAGLSQYKAVTTFPFVAPNSAPTLSGLQTSSDYCGAGSGTIKFGLTYNDADGDSSAGFDLQVSQTTTMPGTYFATAAKSWPSPSFTPNTLNPANVLLGRAVTFTDTSTTCYDAGNTAQSCVKNGNRTYFWSYGDGATCDSIADANCKANTVTHPYSVVGTKTANLQVCDSPGTYCCSTSYLNNVTVKTNLTTPTWKEISPFQ